MPEVIYADHINMRREHYETLSRMELVEACVDLSQACGNLHLRCEDYNEKLEKVQKIGIELVRLLRE